MYGASGTRGSTTIFAGCYLCQCSNKDPMGNDNNRSALGNSTPAAYWISSFVALVRPLSKSATVCPLGKFGNNPVGLLDGNDQYFAKSIFGEEERRGMALWQWPRSWLALILEHHKDGTFTRQYTVLTLCNLEVTEKIVNFSGMNY